MDHSFSEFYLRCLGMGVPVAINLGGRGTGTGVASWRCGQFRLRCLVYLGRGDQHMDILD